jgi:hypothetical protein
VLIHSPLVGPTTCSPVAHELQRRGRLALVPSLLGVAEAPVPQWRYVLEAARVATARTDNAIVLAGHSGGGLLLPAIADALTVEVVALVFVDSFLPPASGSLALAAPGQLDQLRALGADGVLPRWSNWFGEDTMRELIADERLRAALEREMPRLPISYFEANIPLPDGWDAVPCGYVLLAAGPYRESATDARDRGWPVLEIPGVQHLAIATDPVAITDALLALEHALIPQPR